MYLTSEINSQLQSFDHLTVMIAQISTLGIYLSTFLPKILSFELVIQVLRNVYHCLSRLSFPCMPLVA